MRSPSTRGIAIVCAARWTIANARIRALGQGLEFFAIDLRAALQNVTDVIALESDDPILDSLFAQFCIGK